MALEFNADSRTGFKHFNLSVQQYAQKAADGLLNAIRIGKKYRFENGSTYGLARR